MTVELPVFEAEPADAVGVALFTITGVGIALSRDVPIVVALMMGVVAGTSGGVLRDIVVNEVPDLFRPGGLYASASLGGSAVFVAALEAGLRYGESALLGAGMVFALRMASLRMGVTMPAPQWIGTEDGVQQRPPPPP